MIKFNSAAAPSFVLHEILTDDPHPDGLTFGDWVKTKTGVVRVFDGDHLDDADLENIIVITVDEFANDVDKRQKVKEIIGRETLREIWKAFQTSGLSETVKGSILQTISVVLTACLAGEVQIARNIANATATTADFTTGRKNVLLGILDAGIAKL